MSGEQAREKGRIVAWGFDGSAPPRSTRLAWAARQADLDREHAPDRDDVGTHRRATAGRRRSPPTSIPSRTPSRLGRHRRGRACAPSTPIWSWTRAWLTGIRRRSSSRRPKDADLLVVGSRGHGVVRRHADRLGQRLLRHQRGLPGARVPRVVAAPRGSGDPVEGARPRGDVVEGLVGGFRPDERPGVVGTLAKCDPFGTPSTSHWTGAAIIGRFPRTKTCIVMRPRTSTRPMPFSLAG